MADLTAAEPPQLSRSLSLSSASAISTGLAFAAIGFLGMAAMLTYVSGPLSWIAVLAGGVVILGVRAVFSELNGLYPSAAGIRLWMGRAMNDRVALIITMTYMTAIVLVIGADAYIIGEALAYAFHNGNLVAMAYVTVLLVLATWLNLRGIKLAGAAEKVVTSIVVVGTVVIGVVTILDHQPLAHPGAGSSSSPLQALILGIFLYTGFEWVTTNAEEVTKPKTIQRAMLVAVLVMAVSQGVFVVAMGLTLDGDQLSTAYPQLLVAQATLGHLGLLMMLAITALTAVNTFNGGFVTLSRFIYAVAREGKLPRALTRLNDRAVPVLPVYLLGGSSLVLAGVVALTGSFLVMVSVCAALEMMIYAAAGYVVWRLRRRDPDQARPFRMRGGAFVALGCTGLFSVLGILASLTVGADISPVPLLIVGGFAVLATVYVLAYVPRLERREAEELAARREARAAARAAGRVNAKVAESSEGARP